jgi:capsular exopolysaccharide synthesis family protein
MAMAPAVQAQVNPRVILRGLNRHWWRILLIWLAVSIPLAGVIWKLVEPTYEAFSLLEFQPTSIDLFKGGLEDKPDLRSSMPYLETQVQIITSNPVLDEAIGQFPIGALSMLRGALDAPAELREKMVVEIVGKNTYLVKVSLESNNADEAAKIVRAVVNAYTEQYLVQHQFINSGYMSSLSSYREQLDKEIKKTKNELKKVVGNGLVGVSRPELNSKAAEKDTEPSFSSTTDEQYNRATDALFANDMELLKVEAELAAAQDARTKAQEVKGDPSAPAPAGAELAALIEEEFKKDPEVVALAERIADTEEELNDVKAKTRQPGDPVRVKLQKQLKKLQEEEWPKLWEQKYEPISRRVTAAVPELGPNVQDDKIAALQARSEHLKRQKVSLAAYIQTNLDKKKKDSHNDELEATLLNQELLSHRRHLELIQEKITQLEFEKNHETYHVKVLSEARASLTPSNNKRLKYVAAAPVGILFLMVGLFLMLEIKAERVADPEALSSRTHSEVYALPPLPTARSIRKRSAPGADDQIEQFIQRLDHLRFAVCGNPAELEKGRCLLITSAIGGEGKTTLAAQLAARCGNAGMSTLLIDADLRRSALCSLLDVPEGPGLSDALVHDETAFTELVIPVQGGTFYLLPSGTPVQDASRALQNRKLGLLIAQFRQLYDLIIIDSPPVLPVPDALILSRWVDGAVLAARYDISRFPQVERARRQLDSAGIAILGTVINGMRYSDSYYGRYSYNRRRSPQPDSSSTI